MIPARLFTHSHTLSPTADARCLRNGNACPLVRLPYFCLPTACTPHTPQKERKGKGRHEPAGLPWRGRVANSNAGKREGQSAGPWRGGGKGGMRLCCCGLSTALRCSLHHLHHLRRPAGSRSHRPPPTCKSPSGLQPPEEKPARRARPALPLTLSFSPSLITHHSCPGRAHISYCSARLLRRVVVVCCRHLLPPRRDLIYRPCPSRSTTILPPHQFQSLLNHTHSHSLSLL